MKSFLILGCSVLAGFFLIVPGNLSAQGRGGMAAAPHAAPAAVPHAMPAARPAGSLAGSGAGHPVVHAAPVSGARVAPGHGAVRAGSGNMRVRTVNGVPHIVVRRSNGIAPIMTPPISSRGRHMAPEPVFDEDENPNFRTVPGLGFDFPHLAAVFGPDAVGGGRHHQRFDGVGSFVPFFDGGFFLPQEPVVEEEAGSDQTATTQDQPEKTERNSESASRSRYEAPSRSPEPPPDSSQYVFVKRDGTLVFAVAYSWENENTLKYVTNQGLWGTVSRDALDLDATTQFNQQRGLSFQAPTSATRG